MHNSSFVELIEHENDDLIVLNAAKVSHKKQAAAVDSSNDFLIRYLAKHRHFTPFGHARWGGEFFVPDVDLMIDWLMQRKPGWTIRKITTSMFEIEGSLFNWLSDLGDLPPIDSDSLLNLRSALIGSGCAETVKAFLGDDQFKAASDVGASRGLIKPSSWHTFKICAPVFILRQLMRSNHEIVYNEISRRYVNDDPTYFIPEIWRDRPPKNIKQGSGAGEVRVFDSELVNEWINTRGHFPFALDLKTCYSDWIQTAGELYKLFDRSGVAPEMSRILLPLSMYSEVYMTCSTSALNRILGLRSNKSESNHAQKEIEQVCSALDTIRENCKIKA